MEGCESKVNSHYTLHEVQLVQLVHTSHLPQSLRSDDSH